VVDPVTAAELAALAAAVSALEQQQRDIDEALKASKNITQQELAEALGVTQNRVSKFERLDLDKAEIRTLRRYLAALGGTLVLQVELEGKSFHLALD
jgi:predicted XRE-type DNA-binding protein